MLEIFEPYLPFIAFVITIIVNIILIKNNVNWVILIVGNVLITLLLSFVGVEYNFLAIVIKNLVKIIIEILESLFDALLWMFRSLINFILGRDDGRSHIGGGS